MKTIRKSLVRAFTKIAKERHWDNSAKTPYNLSRYGFKSARDWGRHMVSMYELDNVLEMPESLVEAIEYCKQNDMPITQHDFDYFAEEELSCW